MEWRQDPRWLAITSHPRVVVGADGSLAGPTRSRTGVELMGNLKVLQLLVVIYRRKILHLVSTVISVWWSN